MAEIIQTLNGITPLGLAAGLAYVIYLQVTNRGRVANLETNHLHELPEMANTLRRIEAAMTEMRSDVVHIKARVNGKP